MISGLITSLSFKFIKLLSVRLATVLLTWRKAELLVPPGNTNESSCFNPSFSKSKLCSKNVTLVPSKTSFFSLFGTHKSAPTSNKSFCTCLKVGMMSLDK